uniref:RING-type domain-containing protein n=1 Tax=Chromera velia CCMP2878 TaxID=1169474 RepID=A0A0G4HX45_9ALVE|eukprot:Cvel_32995.t1-p1 / transcript=Cvel_32995.t1 / gene=Cvel_32995 / organism=Chromera_velia_CCMP2878 / gene_product=hypothetical protein / transcript_product=hypothetical protein / location=Cvel_scaffold5251:1137-4379(+) / protein_length=281 / sequence_SO=supercontig / SO=protein_coding / is_pseudo=false
METPPPLQPQIRAAADPFPETVGRSASITPPAPLPAVGDDASVPRGESQPAVEGTAAIPPQLLPEGLVLPHPLQGGGGTAEGDRDVEAGALADPEDPNEAEEEELVNKDCPICFFEMSTGRKRPVFCSGSPSCGKCICNECFSQILQRATQRLPARCPFCRRMLSSERRYNEDLMGLLTASRPEIRQYTLPAHPTVSFVRMPRRTPEGRPTPANANRPGPQQARRPSRASAGRQQGGTRRNSQQQQQQEPAGRRTFRWFLIAAGLFALVTVILVVALTDPS